MKNGPNLVSYSSSSRWFIVAALLIVVPSAGCEDHKPVEGPSLVRQSIPLPAPSRNSNEKVDAVSLSDPELQNSSDAAKHARRLVSRLATPGLDPLEWERVQQELIGLGESAVRELSRILGTGSDLEREQAATTLVLLGPDAAPAAEALKGALADRSEFVRANAAAALVQLPGHSQAAIPVLLDLLRSDDPHLQELAATNLHALGPEVRDHVGALPDLPVRSETPDTLVPGIQLLGQGTRLEQTRYESAGELEGAAGSAIPPFMGTSSSQP